MQNPVQMNEASLNIVNHETTRYLKINKIASFTYAFVRMNYDILT